MKTEREARFALNCVMRDFLMRNQKIIRNNDKSFDLLGRYFSNTLSAGFLLSKSLHQRLYAQSKIVTELQHTLSDEISKTKLRMLAYADLIDDSAAGRSFAKLNASKNEYFDGLDSIVKMPSPEAISVKEESECIVASIKNLNKQFEEYESEMCRYAKMANDEKVYKRVDDLLNHNDHILCQMDLFVESQKQQEPTFYEEYSKIRQIYRSGIKDSEPFWEDRH